MIKQVRFADYVEQITQMMLANTGIEPVEIDIPINRYVQLDQMGVLTPILWFDGETIKGMALMMVSPSLRNPKTIDAQADVIYVKPEHRGKSSVFMDGIKEVLRGLGVSLIYISSREAEPIDGFLIKNNFNPLERVFYCEVA